MLQRLAVDRGALTAHTGGRASIHTSNCDCSCLRRFHDARVRHADLTASNIMLGASGEVWVLDFDRGLLREPGAWRDTQYAGALIAIRL